MESNDRPRDVAPDMTLSVVVKFLLPALWNPRIGPERPLSTEDLLRRFLDSDFGRRHIPDPAMIDESASVEQPATAPDGPMEVAARTAWETMREVSWTASRHGTRPESAGPAAWDSEVIDAIERAVSLSLGAGLPRVGMAQVVLGLLADPCSAASRLVERSGGWRDLVVQELRARFEESGHNVAWVPAVDSLLMLGQLRSRLPVLRVVFGAPIAWGLRRRGSSASLSVLAEEAARQAVRHGGRVGCLPGTAVSGPPVGGLGKLASSAAAPGRRLSGRAGGIRHHLGGGGAVDGRR
jgi:hypothetical protein